jgi:hypothetical protein
MGLTSAGGQCMSGIGSMHAAMGEQAAVASGPLVTDYARKGASCAPRRSDYTPVLSTHSKREHYP